MGCYVNPEGMEKEIWLMRKAAKVGQIHLSETPLKDVVTGAEDQLADRVPAWSEFNFPEELPVVLMMNDNFTAAGVGYSQKEYEDFTDMKDDRPKIIFKAKLEDLKAVAPVDTYMRNFP